MKFQVIYLDAPWPYRDRKLIRKDGKSAKYGWGAVNNYPLMSFEDIYNLPIKDLADPEGCVIASWATSPNLKEAIEAFNRWGFTYTTVGFVWVKTYPKAKTPFFGVGSYTGSNVEYVLFGRYGKQNPVRVNKDVPQVHMLPHPRDTNGKIIHSGKPIEFREALDRLYGDVNRIELFARDLVGPMSPGWRATGKDYDGLDIRDSIYNYRYG